MPKADTFEALVARGIPKKDAGIFAEAGITLPSLDKTSEKELLRLFTSERQTIKIVTLSAEGCIPCRDLQQEIANLSGKYDINLVVIDGTSIVDDPKGIQPDTIPEAFGEVDGVPITIIETEKKSRKLAGYTEGELEKVIKEVLGPEEDNND